MFNVNAIQQFSAKIDTIQVGMDEWRDIRTTKVFENTTTINDILIWANTPKGSHTLASLIISNVAD